MKILSLGLTFFLIILFTHNNAFAMEDPVSSIPDMQAKDSVLRHVVLLKFKFGTTTEKISEVCDAFVRLQSKISQIESLEWGVNSSPEGLEKGFTHCFFLTFRSEEDRDAYLPHPDHKAFGKILGPVLEDVLVVDFWAN